MTLWTEGGQMPLDEREKEELAEKIMEQRRAMWKGKTVTKRPTKKGRESRKSKSVLDRQQKREEVKQAPTPYQEVADDDSAEKHEEIERTSESKDKREKEELTKKIVEQRRSVWKGKTAVKPQTKRSRESKRTERTLDRQKEHVKIGQTLARHSDKPRVKRRDENIQSRVPSLKLALLVIVGLIAAIAMGVAIGYLVAVRDLVKI